MPDMNTAIGAVVVTADGKELGHVKELEGECFKIDVSLAPDFWIAADVVDVAAPDTVQLLFTKAEIPAVFDPEAGHSGYHVH